MELPESTLDLGFSDDAVIVTGAANGIGRATALLAGSLGLGVAVWDLDGPGAEATASRLRAQGGRAVPAVVDVGDPGQVEAGLDSAEALGPVRYLVNNAGPPSSADMEFNTALALSLGNLRQVTEAWLARGVPDAAAVVNVASIAGTSIGAGADWYASAKAGIAGYTRYLAGRRAAELRANAVAPGLIHTRRMRESGFPESGIGRAMVARIPVGRGGEPAEVANAILFLLSPLAAFITGAVLPVDGGTLIAR